VSWTGILKIERYGLPFGKISNMDHLLEIINTLLIESEDQYKTAQETEDVFYRTFYLGQTVGFTVLRDRILTEELRLKNQGLS
jgi:hypothetical protein